MPMYRSAGLISGMDTANVPQYVLLDTSGRPLVSVSQWGGVAQSGADLTPLLQHLNVDLSTRATETTLAKSVPTAKGAVFNTAVLANTDMLGAAVTPTNSPSRLRVTIAMSTSGVFSARLTQGGTTLGLNLNSGVSLTANALYTFDMPWRTGDSINFQTTVAGTILVLYADEIGLAT